jgi:hypothetical protein
MQDFLKALYQDAEGLLTLWTKQDKATKWHDIQDQDAIINDAQELAASMDVYYGVGLRGTRAATGRGLNEDVTVIPGLWVDMDIAGPGHKTNDLPPDTDAAIALLQEFPLQPTMLIHSGGGLHGYWLFEEPWAFDTDAEREEAADLLQRFQATLRQKAQTHGWKLDSTHDLARVLRLPGTTNHKTDPGRPVQILKDTGERYNPSDFEDYLIEIQPQQKTSTKRTNTETGDAAEVIDRCLFIQHCRDDAARLPEPEWYAMIANLARTNGGPEAIHKLSQPYPGYSARETDEKIQHSLDDGQPHTCEYIQRDLGFQGCPAGGCGVTAPVSFATNRLVMARIAVDGIGDRPQDIWQPETIGALAVLKKEDPAEYAQIKAALKGKINMNDLERAVNKQMADNQKMRVVQADDPGIEAVLPDAPLKELRIPHNWTVTANGIWQTRRTKNGEVEAICACPVPVILTKRMRNIDSGEEKVELAYHRDGAWHKIAAPRGNVFNRQGLNLLANKGLPVSSESAKHLVKFLDDLERENLNLLPVVRTTSHLGWVGRGQFLPGACEDVLLDTEEGTGTAAIADGYREQGTMEGWIESMQPVREQPIARFLLAASFAAPLLDFLGHRVFIIHVWGPSRGGKTAALKAALSVWGNPEDLLASFNATKVGLERLASFYSDLPLGIDERQVLGDRQGFVESLVYLLGLGKGKARGSKGGGLQRFAQWRTIALTTGEQPLAGNSSAAGVRTRALELYGVPVPDEETAMRIHAGTGEHFGTAGPVFIRRLITQIKEDPGALRDDYEATRAQLMDGTENVTSHMAAVAVVALADYLASQWVFGEAEGAAGAGANAMAQTISALLETAAEADEGLRAHDYFLSWYAIHGNYFDQHDSGLRERYGLAENGLIYVYPPIFDAAMEAGGFNANRILRDWADRDWIETEQRAGENFRRMKVRKWDPATRKNSNFIGVIQDRPEASDLSGK